MEQTPPLTVYSDQLAPGWHNYSWDVAIDFMGGPPYRGTSSLSMVVAASGGGLCFQLDDALDLGSYDHLGFAARTTDSGQRYQVFLYDADNQVPTYVWLANEGGDPIPGTWTEYAIPLADLGATGKRIRGIGMQRIDGGLNGAIYIDEIAFLAPAPPPLPDPVLSIFDDALSPGWMNWSWGAAVNTESPAPVYSGSMAIATAPSEPRDGLCLMAEQAFATGPYASLHFAARAAADGQHYQLFPYGADGQPNGVYVSLEDLGGQPSASFWRVYDIPLSRLGAAGSTLKGLAIQSTDDAVTRGLYVDEVALVGSPVAPLPPLPEPVMSVFGDALSPGWMNWSWGAAVNTASTSPVYSGSTAIATAPAEPGDGLCLMAEQPFATGPFSCLHFAARAAADGQHYQLIPYGADGQPNGRYISLADLGGQPSASAWRVYDAPLALLGAVGSSLKGIAIQSTDGAVNRGLFVDEVAFVGSPEPPVPPQPQGPIVLGAYVSGAPGTPDEIDNFASLVGRPPAIVMWYQGWGISNPGDFDSHAADVVIQRGAVPMVTWMPCGESEAPDQPDFSLKTIVAGKHDAYIHRWAKAAATWNKQLFLRFAHEMNGNWYPWAIGQNGNVAQDYVDAWRHVHDIFREEGATKLLWVWTPNVVTAGAGLFVDEYPGDDYVDWVGLGGYNWGTTKSDQQWLGLRDVFDYSYQALVGISSKPVLIAETASTEQGGDKPSWITQGLMTDVPARLPALRAFIWFHEDKETDWRVNSTDQSETAFRQVATSDLYSGKLP